MDVEPYVDIEPREAPEIEPWPYAGLPEPSWWRDTSPWTQKLRVNMVRKRTEAKELSEAMAKALESRLRERKAREERERRERAERHAAESHKPVQRAARWRRFDLPPIPPVEAGWRAAYVRFGERPPNDLSFNYFSGISRPEAGLSVFPAYATPEGRYMIDFREDVAMARCFVVWWNFEERKSTRPVFVVEGREVGIGGAGEPLLADVTSFEPLPPGARVVPIVELPEWFCALARRPAAFVRFFYAGEDFLAEWERAAKAP